MKVGIDVLETSRVKTDVRFLKSFLNESEIEYVSKFENPTERIAGLFCAKEAVFKALCEKQFSPHNITISHDETGAVTDAEFNFVARDEFERTYDILK